jgi:hypothetical protein
MGDFPMQSAANALLFLLLVKLFFTCWSKMHHCTNLFGATKHPAPMSWCTNSSRTNSISANKWSKLKGHGNGADFWGFCINRFLMSPLHNLSSSSDFGFEFAEIFKIETRLPTRRVGESTRLPVDTIFSKPLNKSMVKVLFVTSLAYFLLKWSFKGLV